MDARALARLSALALLVAACTSGTAPRDVPTGGGITLTSAGIGSDGAIAVEHTCDGSGTPLPLSWTGLGENARALAITMIDRSAGNFVHWVLYNVDPVANVGGLTQDPSTLPTVDNDFGKPGYGGPCPPPGDGPHEYVITLHVLGEPLTQEGGGSLADEIERARVDGGTLIGTYERTA